MTEIQKGFASDNSSGVHSEVLAKLAEVNQGHVNAYGYDAYTEQASDYFKKEFGEDTEAFFVFSGTAANVLGISNVIKPFQAVICAESSHTYVDECGAIENFSGSKLLPIETTDGKLTVELIKQRITGRFDEHHAQVKIIQITQITELGTLYSLDEIKQITKFAHENNFLVYMDGARLANAACALELPFHAFTKDVDVDILSVGGTKNGLMGAEAVVFLNPKLAEDFKYVRKQGMQLASKMRFLSAQYLAYFENDLWKESATHANQMGQLLARGLSTFETIKFMQQPAANMIFAYFPEAIIQPLQQQFPFYLMESEAGLVRLVCSFDTEEADVEAFIAAVQELI